MGGYHFEEQVRPTRASTNASQRHRSAHPAIPAYRPGMVVLPNKSLDPTPQAKGALDSLRAARSGPAELKRWASSEDR